MYIPCSSGVYVAGWTCGLVRASVFIRVCVCMSEYVPECLCLCLCVCLCVRVFASACLCVWSVCVSVCLRVCVCACR